MVTPLRTTPSCFIEKRVRDIPVHFEPLFPGLLQNRTTNILYIAFHKEKILRNSKSKKLYPKVHPRKELSVCLEEHFNIRKAGKFKITAQGEVL
jgi:hypothetical protein